ncbi:hypothetical protein CDD82_6748 [Ophiocordyceps australis]|uniref:Terpenoid synthase n=1 Tax=Ophiocordyceps australis TaxID=1399860 RepID=A0A2C5ZQT3_9HYPO|nr:hypothetical protein CDD82_6748 [Ophiocordyceps australis]
MPTKTLPDDICTAPVIKSRFPSRIHPALDELHKRTQKMYAHSLEPLVKNKPVTKHGAYVACGGTMAAYIYPDAELQRLKALSDSFVAGVFIDDMMDNSTDLEYVEEVIENYRAAFAGSLRACPEFDFIMDFFTDSRWDHAALELVQPEFNLYLDSTLSQRRIETERRVVTAEEYLTYREGNTYMGVTHLLSGFVYPHLTHELVRVCSLAPETIRLVFKYSGLSVGVSLDMYKLNGKHSEVCEYTNIVKIIQRASSGPCSLSEALCLACNLFHEYEEKMAIELEKIAALSPEVADAIRFMHGGTISWMENMRGSRYSKIIKGNTSI